ncbi:dihydroorotate oxidase B, catalytic subunit [Anaerobranca californiensis DSM 14826]|jgi:dihydroorotate dehydrogenase (NAD+) catalytic subunit|uniref:Dihydroorotate dehydrogenase n=1 Tax=Anaerobranca californiensis DSM 14826 TaxID=1120989 RepID=A0A1M6LGP7_9FIRM|nr:dihydroorotate dehydrogenase [Anaerobranca californiensis]SHJ70278.1 dihydroorotate oxidase B, catalytic subunit [Anaerobranca californiensis DSM 14826]
MIDLSIELFQLKLKNPVTVASGTYGFGEVYEKFYHPKFLGAITTKGLTLEKREGNKGVRCVETASGILNSVGLQNPGIDVFIKEHLPNLKSKGALVFVNIAGKTVEEFIELGERLEKTDVDLIELNLSCPNVKEGGLAFGISPKKVGEITKKVRMVTKKPIVVKLSPNVTNIVEIAKEAEFNGADGLTLINTLQGMAIDIDSKRPILGNIYGGLSGPAIKPVALRMVYDVYKNVKIPIIGMGGIVTYQDAVEFILAGASMIGVGTGNFIDPFAPIKIIEGLKKYMEIYRFNKVEEMVGLAHSERR